MKEDARGRDEGPGLITLVTLVSKAFYRRSFEEQLGMKLKEFQVLGYLSEHLGRPNRSWAKPCSTTPTWSCCSLTSSRQIGRASCRERV